MNKQEPLNGLISNGPCPPYWSEKRSERIQIHNRKHNRRKDNRKTNSETEMGFPSDPIRQTRAEQKHVKRITKRNAIIWSTRDLQSQSIWTDESGESRLSTPERRVEDQLI